MKRILLIFISIVMLGCKGNAQKEENTKNNTYKVTKTEAEWKAQLTPMEYYVLREEGTERAFTSSLNSNYEEGTYVCKACNTPLFKSEHKFDSGTGWPSFDREKIGRASCRERDDTS